MGKLKSNSLGIHKKIVLLSVFVCVSQSTLFITQAMASDIVFDGGVETIGLPMVLSLSSLKTQFFDACCAGNSDVVAKILNIDSDGVDEQLTDSVKQWLLHERFYDMSPLEAAIRSGSIDTVKILCEAGAQVTDEHYDLAYTLSRSSMERVKKYNDLLAFLKTTLSQSFDLLSVGSDESDVSMAEVGSDSDVLSDGLSDEGFGWFDSEERVEEVVVQPRMPRCKPALLVRVVSSGVSPRRTRPSVTPRTVGRFWGPLALLTGDAS